MYHKKYIFFSFCLVLCVSCTKKFLDVDNTQQLFRESYVKDLTTMQEYVRGVYFNIASSVEGDERQASYVDLVADDLKPNTTSSNPFYNWAQTELITLSSLWTNSYLTIRMCNFAINN